MLALQKQLRQQQKTLQRLQKQLAAAAKKQKPKKRPAVKKPTKPPAKKQADRKAAAAKKKQQSDRERQQRQKAADKAAKQKQLADDEKQLLAYRRHTPAIAAAIGKTPPADYKRWTGNVSTLNEHQKDAICSTITSRQRGHIYFFGLGSGKTRSAITAAEQYGGGIVIAPATLRSNWRSELKKWNAVGKYQILSFQEFYRKPINLTGQFVIVDEAHTLRTSGSKMSKIIFNELKKAFKVVLLTGTPLYNRPTDISVLLNPVQTGPKLPTTDDAYETEFGKRPSEFAKLVRDNVIYYKPAADPMNYPAVVETTVKLQATAEQAAVYKALEDKNLTQLAQLDNLIGAKLDNLSAADLANVAKLMKKLQAFGTQARQIANRDPRGAKYVPKSKYILAYAKKHPKQRLLIFSQFLNSGLQPTADLLKANGIKYGIYTGEQSQKDRAKTVDAYNAGKLNVLMLSSAGAEGLDLKRTDAVFILEPHWNWSKIRQMIGRAARFQSHPPNSTVKVFKFLTTFPAAKLKGIEQAMVKIADDKQRRIDEQVRHIIDASGKVVQKRRRKCGL